MINSGEMTKLVRKAIKEVRDTKQDLYGKLSEDLKPITEKNG